MRADNGVSTGAESIPLLRSRPGSNVNYGSFRKPSHCPDDAIHKVSPTDSLGGIALKYNVTVESIKRKNGLLSDSDIWLRDELRISKGKEETFELSTKITNPSALPRSFAAGNFKNMKDYLSNFDSRTENLKKESMALKKRISFSQNS